MRRFTGICIITKDVNRLSNFYRQILQVEARQEGDNFSFATEGALFSIFSYDGMEQMVPGCMEGVGGGSHAIDFEVDNIDEEYERLTQMGVPCIKPPITYPWGRRSAWFRDPDGNIVNFFSAVCSN